MQARMVIPTPCRLSLRGAVHGQGIYAQVLFAALPADRRYLDWYASIGYIDRIAAPRDRKAALWGVSLAERPCPCLWTSLYSGEAHQRRGAFVAGKGKKV
jgi:hypothetical protein